MRKSSFRDYATHSIRRSDLMNVNVTVSHIQNPSTRARVRHPARKHRPTSASPLTLASLPPPRTTYKSVGRMVAIRNTLEFLYQHFHHTSPENAVENALALYERNILIYEKKYVAKKEVWAAACYSVDAELRKSKFSYKEIAAAFAGAGTLVEPKRICKVAGYIKKHERELAGKGALQTGRVEECGGNLSWVTRLASELGMDFKQEKLARAIVAFIDEEELISGLNPLSVLSVSFFLAFSLSAKAASFNNNTPSFVKETLNEVSQKLFIATDTIRNGIKKVRADVLEMVLREQTRLNISRQVVDMVAAWEL